VALHLLHAPRTASAGTVEGCGPPLRAPTPMGAPDSAVRYLRRAEPCPGYRPLRAVPKT
jgi:hypothetical protein